MIRAVGTLRFVVGLCRIGLISFFAFAVVTFRSQILAFRSLMRFFTSRSLALYSSQLIPSLSLSLSCSLSSFAIYLLRLPVLSFHPNCLQFGMFLGSSEQRFVRGSVHLSKGFTISESTSSHLFINCCCKCSQIHFLPIPVELFSPLCFSVGQWIVATMVRVSSGCQSYLSSMAAWMIVASGEEKSPVAGSCLVGCSGSLRNVLFTSMEAFTRYLPLALGLAAWSHAV